MSRMSINPNFLFSSSLIFLALFCFFFSLLHLNSLTPWSVYPDGFTRRKWGLYRKAVNQEVSVKGSLLVEFGPVITCDISPHVTGINIHQSAELCRFFHQFRHFFKLIQARKKQQSKLQLYCDRCVGKISSIYTELEMPSFCWV